MVRIAVGALPLALVACATSPIRWASPADFTLAIIDNSAQQRFDLILTSNTVEPLCLSKEAWPAEEALPAGFDGATLMTSSGKKNLLPTGSAYCLGGCGDVRVEPGQLVRGILPYAAFGDAVTIAADPARALTFEVHPFSCSN